MKKKITFAALAIAVIGIICYIIFGGYASKLFVDLETKDIKEITVYLGLAAYF
ncbi:hypothetical protein [Oxobacter pfennigii]|uniref:hypothetical protein n=1 Tax=Oxobacter pfennigii TaxID=36849 RepID=UPI001364C305|nr:hypothetical protein [Oxobacter pfennigii]